MNWFIMLYGIIMGLFGFYLGVKSQKEIEGDKKQ